jgi:hypothetical protein
MLQLIQNIYNLIYNMLKFTLISIIFLYHIHNLQYVSLQYFEDLILNSTPLHI